MVYILNTNLSGKKKVPMALSAIFGIGTHSSQQICDKLGIASRVTVDQLSTKKINQLARFIRQYYETGSQLRRNIRNSMERYVYIAAYRGFRYTQGLPVRGQRTHGNARTVRKKAFRLK